MAFVETPIFPEHISSGCQFGPRFSTTVVQTFGGQESRNQNWAMPIYEGDVGHAALKQALYDDLLAFFLYVGGMANGFRFKHFGDWTVTGSQGTLVNLTANTWQMYKTYTYGALTKTRKISKPRSGCVVAGGGTYAVDTTTGIITKSAGANPSGWTGTFDTPVRFNTDKMQVVSHTLDVYEWSSIPIIELKL